MTDYSDSDSVRKLNAWKAEGREEVTPWGDGDLVLIHHPAEDCAGEHCCIHNPSDHHMVDWSLNWRGDRGMMERICPQHGVGHPDPDDLAFKRRNGLPDSEGIHGCCGCCGVL